MIALACSLTGHALILWVLHRHGLRYIADLKKEGRLP